jgi:hypothetical protein
VSEPDGGPEPEASPPGRDPTAVLGWALLFAAPVGVGVSAAVMRVTGQAALDPTVALPGAAAAVAVFVLVVVAAAGGSPDPDADRGKA